MCYLQLHKVENFAAKVVLNRKICESSLQALHDLHWLPIHVRIDFKILMLVFKCLHEKFAPCYLKDLLVTNKHTGMYGNLRSNSKKCRTINYTLCKKKQKFCHSGILCLWSKTMEQFARCYQIQ